MHIYSWFSRLARDFINTMYTWAVDWSPTFPHRRIGEKVICYEQNFSRQDAVWKKSREPRILRSIPTSLMFTLNRIMYFVFFASYINEISNQWSATQFYDEFYEFFPKE